jgi:hypothetical protein
MKFIMELGKEYILEMPAIILFSNPYHYVYMHAYIRIMSVISTRYLPLLAFAHSQ